MNTKTTTAISSLTSDPLTRNWNQSMKSYLQMRLKSKAYQDEVEKRGLEKDLASLNRQTSTSTPEK